MIIILGTIIHRDTKAISLVKMTIVLGMIVTQEDMVEVNALEGIEIVGHLWRNFSTLFGRSMQQIEGSSMEIRYPNGSRHYHPFESADRVLMEAEAARIITLVIATNLVTGSLRDHPHLSVDAAADPETEEAKARHAAKSRLLVVISLKPENDRRGRGRGRGTGEGGGRGGIGEGPGPDPN